MDACFVLSGLKLGRGVRVGSRVVGSRGAGVRVGRFRMEIAGGERDNKSKLAELEDLAKIEGKLGRDVMTADDVVLLRDEGVKEYNKSLLQLLGDTAFLGLLGGAVISFFYPFNTALSFEMGSLGSLLYVFLLSRTVDRLAVKARAGERGSDILGPARFFVLAGIIIWLAKNQDRTGLPVIPAILGFLCYKIALLLPLLNGKETIDI
eukprot:CAMPEP_0113969242 /NCGR_PEP_ID=MMETSP0011_2-20120614/10140_1 /TAXON_ID=101924 /ORGANISM="Rhodosorus marinus" /LENGTH=206 /DNA_ID=CAMNT_0000982741 /DNA_START=58 /DNA_END=681 /DNA_ORIENTATION=- /assembly_acc=CAM_ASM_000156